LIGPRSAQHAKRATSLSRRISVVIARTAAGKAGLDQSQHLRGMPKELSDRVRAPQEEVVASVNSISGGQQTAAPGRFGGLQQRLCH